MTQIEPLLVQQIIPVSGAEIRTQVRENATDIAIRQYFKSLVPYYPPQKITQLRTLLQELSVPEILTCELLSLTRINRPEQIALISSSLGHKLSVKAAEAILQALRS